jgi:hypothetical protein
MSHLSDDPVGHPIIGFYITMIDSGYTDAIINEGTLELTTYSKAASNM